MIFILVLLCKIRLEDGVVLDEKVFHNDFINLAHNMGVFLYDDLLAIVSLRYQTIHILQVRDSGNLVDVRTIGSFCREDDELFLISNSQARCISIQAFDIGWKVSLLFFIHLLGGVSVYWLKLYTLVSYLYMGGWAILIDHSGVV